ncbi:MAG: ABC transporter ATP-binding protein [Anaerovoracaceae bacterium]
MLSINNLSIEYGNGFRAVNNFSLEMKQGEIVSIVGESGSGKTTVIRTVLGALPESAEIVSGDIKFNGKSIISYSREQWRTLRGNEISMIFQDAGGTLNPIRKIGSQFKEFICQHSNMSESEAEQRAMIMLRRTNLPNAENIMKSYPFQLSGGMKQRVGIAMAMTFEPKLLLADEPTSALDVTTQAQIVRQMAHLRENYNTGIILVTHNLGVAAYLSDRIIVMHHGEIVEEGTSRDIIEKPRHEYTRKLIKAVPQIGGNRFV